jgi:hypothetical protein
MFESLTVRGTHQVYWISYMCITLSINKNGAYNNKLAVGSMTSFGCSAEMPLRQDRTGSGT